MLKYSSGFTLLETLIVISLIAMLGGLSLIVQMSSVTSYEFYQKQREVFELIMKARSAALHNKLETNWGVYADAGSGKIILFSGSAPTSYESLVLGDGIHIATSSVITFLQLSAQTGGGNVTLSDNFGRTSSLTVNSEGGISLGN